jgi:hypothetical protein
MPVDSIFDVVDIDYLSYNTEDRSRTVLLPLLVNKQLHNEI